jgi:hypothetical protein
MNRIQTAGKNGHTASTVTSEAFLGMKFAPHLREKTLRHINHPDMEIQIPKIRSMECLCLL